VVEPRVGRIDPVEPVHVGVAGAVGRVPVTARLVKPDPLDRGALGDARLERAVEPHVEAAVLAQHDRRPPAEDHALAGRAHPQDVPLAVPPKVRVLMLNRQRRLRRPGRHRRRQAGEQPAGGREAGLVGRQRLRARAGRADAASAVRRSLHERNPEPPRQRRPDHAAPGPVGRRHRHQPDRF
jgi:hypothetical protein